MLSHLSVQNEDVAAQLPEGFVSGVNLYELWHYARKDGKIVGYGLLLTDYETP